MSLYIRGTTYWIEVRRPDGTRIRESTGTSDQQDAQRYMDNRIKQLAAGQITVVNWEHATARWLQERTDKRSLDRDRSMITWLERHLNGKVFATITNDDVKAVVELKRSETTPSNANHYLKFIKSLFNRSIDWGYIDANPVRMKPYPAPKARVRFLAEDEMERLMSELPHHLRVMAEFSVLTGLRMSNVTGLRWNRVDMKRRIAWVHGTEYKTGHDHAVPLSDRAIEILEGEMGVNETYVFTYNGYPVTNTNTAAWQKALKRAGIENFRWHDLRHTFASYHAMNGTPLLTLKHLGGWRSLDMVNRYAHLSAEGARQYVGNSSPTTVG